MISQLRLDFLIPGWDVKSAADCGQASTGVKVYVAADLPELVYHPETPRPAFHGTGSVQRPSRRERAGTLNVGPRQRNQGGPNQRLAHEFFGVRTAAEVSAGVGGGA